MTKRQCFEALDRSLRDIVAEKEPKAKDIPFGGKVVVLGGDPKQILPVIENASKLQIINALIFTSYLSNYAITLHLYENMGLQKLDPHSTEYRELEDFNDWTLSIGNGTIKSDLNDKDDNTDLDSNTIEVPKNLLVNTTENKVEVLINYVYPDFKMRFNEGKLYLVLEYT